MPFIQKLYALECHKLIDFNLASIQMLMHLFGIHIDMIFSSDVQPQGTGCDLLVDLLQKVRGTHYLSGTGARNYYQQESFDAADITVEWQRYEPLTYPQRYPGFIPNLSSIDIFFNCGVQSARNMLRKNEKGADPN
jgi:hypothetical protein